MYLPYRTKFRRIKFSTRSRNFDSFVRFLPDSCIETLDKIFDGHNFTSEKIFDTKSKFRQFCPTNFCPIMYSCAETKSDMIIMKSQNISDIEELLSISVYYTRHFSSKYFPTPLGNVFQRMVESPVINKWSHFLQEHNNNATCTY